MILLRLCNETYFTLASTLAGVLNAFKFTYPF